MAPQAAKEPRLRRLVLDRGILGVDWSTCCYDNTRWKMSRMKREEFIKMSARAVYHGDNDPLVVKLQEKQAAARAKLEAKGVKPKALRLVPNAKD